jgi:ribonuclease I
MAAARLSLAAALLVLAVVGAAGRAAAQDYDFFYLVLQWPGSYCDTRQSCCYPKSGKPAADFGIHGLWPNRDDGSYPQNCNPDAEFDPSKVRVRRDPCSSFSFLPGGCCMLRLMPACSLGFARPHILWLDAMAYIYVLGALLIV